MVWQPRRLTAAQLEERRLAAGRLLRAGRRSQAEIARLVGVSPAAIRQWAKRLRADANGVAGLRRRPRPGRPTRLPSAAWRRLLGVLRQGALTAGFDTERWTLPRIARVVRREFGVTYHPSSLSRQLKARGWSPQRPATRARERNEALIAAWLKRDWARIKKGLAEQGVSWPLWTRRVTRFGPG